MRGGFSLRKFTEPQQYVWNQASDLRLLLLPVVLSQREHDWGARHLRARKLVDQRLQSQRSADAGIYTRYVYGLSPQTFQASEAASDFTFLGGPGLNGMNPNIQQPYTRIVESGYSAATRGKPVPRNTLRRQPL